MHCMVVVRAVVDVGGTEARLQDGSERRPRGGGQRITLALGPRFPRWGPRPRVCWSSSRGRSPRDLGTPACPD